MSALAPILAFSPQDVPGEIGNPDKPFIDDLGRSVYLESAPESIVALNPAATETIFALDADDKLVAVSNAWLYWIETPEDVDSEIEARVNAGELTALDAFSVSGEAILDLEPDVVFVFGYTLPSYAAAIEGEVPVICFAPESLKDVLYDLVLIGKVTDKEAEAGSLITDIKADITNIASMTIDKPRPKVFCETGYNGGIWTTGENSFVSSLILLAGGDDIGTAVPVGNPVISAEYIASSEPGIIILLDYPWAADAESVAGRPGWSAIPAVITWQANHEQGIYELNALSVDEITRPGPRIAEGLKVLVGIIHPELVE
jgi:iron complex transport system substrate-binding protein